MAASRSEFNAHEEGSAWLWLVEAARRRLR